MTVDSTLDERRQIRDLTRSVAELERVVATLRREMEQPDARAERLRMMALERAVNAQQRFGPFMHLFAKHLREHVLWLAAAMAAQDPDGEVVLPGMLPSLMAIALDDPDWRTLPDSVRAALVELDPPQEPNT
ncbi:MAG: hypothetical protein JSR73_10705 [Proteobacteria bacterium]|nr:hypothetical protein [Pseudomonadota bacterium]